MKYKKYKKNTPCIGIATTWFGADLKGGAEQQAFQLAKRLQEQGYRVRVLTTCSRSFLNNWDENYYAPGRSVEDGLEVLRFPVKRRNQAAFNQVVRSLLSLSGHELIPGLSPLNYDQEQTYWNNNIHSPTLIRWLQEHNNEFSRVIFIPYLFPLAFFGVAALGSKALLQPCLHDEGYAYLQGVFRSFLNCGALLFNSKGEFLLARKIMGDFIDRKSVIVGEGIDFTTGIQEGVEPASAPVEGNYLLYLGRRCEEKNTPLLIREFKKHYDSEHPDIKLVLAGPGSLPDDSLGEGIIDLGLVSEVQKWQLLKGCVALVNPSLNESFSRVIFEAWHYEKPVIVHEDCLATATFVRESEGGGLIAGKDLPWTEAFRLLQDSDKSLPEDMGKKGRAYSENQTSWDLVMERYRKLFESLDGGTLKPDSRDILVVLPWKQGIPEDFQEDLRGFLKNLEELKQGYLLLAPETLEMSAISGLRFSLRELSDLPNRRFRRVIWYSGVFWDGALRFIRSMSLPASLRILDQGNFPQSLPVGMRGFFDRVLSPMSPQTLPGQEEPGYDFLPPFSDIPFQERKSFPASHRDRLQNQYINALAFLEKGEDLQFLEQIAREFQRRYGRGLKFYVPDSPQVMKPGSDVGFSHLQLISSADACLAGYWYSCELLIILGECQRFYPIIRQAGSYALPVLGLNSGMARDFLQAIHISVTERTPDSLQKICACIRLCCVEGEFREEASRQSAFTGRRIQAALHPACMKENLL